MSKAIQGFSVILMALALWIAGAQAQGTEQAVSQPNAASATSSPTESGSPIGMQEAGTARQESVRTTPYNPPLSGAADFTPGGSPTTRSFLLPAVNFSQQMDTNPFTTAHPGSPVALSSILGTLTLERNSGRSQLRLNYVGGGTVANRQSVSNGQTDLNSIVQELEASQMVNWRRWALLLSNQFTYFPESSFGSLLGSPSLPPGIGHSLGEGLPSLQSFLMPSQSILTGRGGRVSNTFLTQMEYDFTARSSVTFAGAYGFLRFLDSDLVNGSTATFMTGYNHQIDRADTLAVIYRFNALRLAGLDGVIDDHVAQLSYGRRITGRLAFRLAGGPEVEWPRANGVAPQSQLLWNLEGALHYRLNRSALDLSYNHGLTGGAGVLAGAETNQAQAAVTRSLSRAWQGSVGLGYANNRSLGSAALFLPANRVFNTWFGSVRFSRSVGRSTEQFIEYVVQLQGSDTPFCTGLICARSLVRHLVTVGFNWYHRPIAIE